MFLFLTQIRTCKNMFMYLTNKVYEVEGIMLHKYTFVPHLSYRLLSDLELRLLWNTRDYYQTWDIKPSVKYERLLSDLGPTPSVKYVRLLSDMGPLWTTTIREISIIPVTYAFCEIRQINIRPGTCALC